MKKYVKCDLKNINNSNILYNVWINKKYAYSNAYLYLVGFTGQWTILKLHNNGKFFDKDILPKWAKNKIIEIDILDNDE